VQLQEKHPDTVKALTVNVEYDGDDGAPSVKFQNSIKAVLKSRGATGENIICSAEITAALDRFGTGLPAAFIYDTEGKLVHTFDGDVVYEGKIFKVVDEMVK